MYSILAVDMTLPNQGFVLTHINNICIIFMRTARTLVEFLKFVNIWQPNLLIEQYLTSTYYILWSLCRRLKIHDLFSLPSKNFHRQKKKTGKQNNYNKWLYIQSSDLSFIATREKELRRCQWILRDNFKKRNTICARRTKRERTFQVEGKPEAGIRIEVSRIGKISLGVNGQSTEKKHLVSEFWETLHLRLGPSKRSCGKWLLQNLQPFLKLDWLLWLASGIWEEVINANLRLMHEIHPASPSFFIPGLMSMPKAMWAILKMADALHLKSPNGSLKHSPLPLTPNPTTITSMRLWHD